MGKYQARPTAEITPSPEWTLPQRAHGETGEPEGLGLDSSCLKETH